MLKFEYNGSNRLVIPCAHGILSTGNEALRCHRVSFRNGRTTIGLGKLYLTEKMSEIEIDEPFAHNPAGYHRGDSAMTDIHCQL